jgi:hypothetical protein
MPNLKKCPFCGGNAKMKINDSTLNCVAFCEKCNVVMKRNFKGNRKLSLILEQLMAEEWNRRIDNA